MIPKHGGDWAGFQSKYGMEPLDFSANVSPLGLPEGVKQAVIDSLELAHRYPDPFCRELRKALGEHYEVSPEWVLCGNGAADLIERLAQALKPKKAMVTAPTFAEYEESLKRVGCEMRYHLLREENDFHITESILEEITPELDLLVLCNPNNPTGVTTGRELMDRILRKCRECGCLLMIDECFIGFLDELEKVTMVPSLSQGGLLILKAFTKFYGMAGLRLGYCLSADTALLDRMAAAGQFWPVSTVAQAAGVAALKEKEYGKKLKAIIREQRPVLSKGLRDLGFHVVPGEANYLLIRVAEENFKEKMEETGTMIRSCGNYIGLDSHWYRVAVRTGEENRELLRRMEKVLH